LDTLVGQSEDPIETEAAREVLLQIEQQLQGTLPQAGILFCSIDYDHAIILEKIQAAFPALELVGCTTDGELCSQLGFSDDSVILVVFVSDAIEVASGIGRHVSTAGVVAGKEAALGCLRKIQKQKNNPKFAIILTDPISAGISGVDVGIKEILGETFPVVGGVAAAHSKQRKTHQFFQNAVETDSVVLLLFAGDIHFSIGIKGGHSPFGLREAVTYAEKNVVYKIGDKTACNYFRHYIGEYDLFMNYCLAVFPDGGDQFYVLSAPHSDAESGSVSLNEPLPDRAEVQIGTADRNIVSSFCRESIKNALAGYKGEKSAPPCFFLVPAARCSWEQKLSGNSQLPRVSCRRFPLPDSIVTMNLRRSCLGRRFISTEQLLSRFCWANNCGDGAMACRPGETPPSLRRPGA